MISLDVMTNLLTSLDIMWKGMLGIFIVMIVLMTIITILTKTTKD